LAGPVTTELHEESVTSTQPEKSNASQETSDHSDSGPRAQAAVKAQSTPHRLVRRKQEFALLSVAAVPELTEAIGTG
jgi:hypothetical protein